MTHNFDEQNPHWYKDAIIYQLHNKSFFDSNDDGIGDFQGLIRKLDYLENLGVTAIWLLPFYPSPLKDDGYDIADYISINPDYGTVKEFRRFLDEAHDRGIRVITELVINHTSDRHPWFQRARSAAPNSSFRNFYVWSETVEKYEDARIIFKDFETSNWSWDAEAKAYYWHRFYSHQPDLNFNNPQVQKEIFRALDFWFDNGVDGLRLDAIPYIFEREGTNCENLPETHALLKKLRAHVDKKYDDKMLLAEANQWPEDAVAYFGSGDECHMAFHFPLMPRMFMALRMEDRFPIIDIIEQTPAIPGDCQWSMFLRNHDELTLEMVTDEERDYMYRVYAKDPQARINLGIRRRLAPLLDNDRRKIELMTMLLFSLPGTPVIYYGDEIGMGDNYYLGDRNGVRTPMQWSPDRNAGFSRVNPHKLFLPVIIDPEYHFETVNVENQQRNMSSLLWWMKRVIFTRKKYKAFGRGDFRFLYPANPKIIAFIREYDEEGILVIINLSRFSQMVELDLSQYSGYVPDEMFSGNKFTEIGEFSYLLSLGPYGYFWFLLEKQEQKVEIKTMSEIPKLYVKNNWLAVFANRNRTILENKIFLKYLRSCSRYDDNVKKVTIIENIPLPKPNTVNICLLILQISDFSEYEKKCVLPLCFVENEKAKSIMNEHPDCVIAAIEVNGRSGVLFDGLYCTDLHQILFSLLDRKKTVVGEAGQLLVEPDKLMKNYREEYSASKVINVRSDYSLIAYNETCALKLYREFGDGTPPDAEVLQYLQTYSNFRNVPPYLGKIKYTYQKDNIEMIALLQGFIPHHDDALNLTTNAAVRYFEKILTSRIDFQQAVPNLDSLYEITFSNIPTILHDLIDGIFLEQIHLLGQRTAELHVALASSSKTNIDFAAENFSTLYQRSIFQSINNTVKKTINLLEKNLTNLPDENKELAREIVEKEHEILKLVKQITVGKINAQKIRIHGDYHLGHILYTGKDFVIINFDGGVNRSSNERRLKYSSLRDVATMMRSFHYACYTALKKQMLAQISSLHHWIEPWFRSVSGIFLNSYLTSLKDNFILPVDRNTIKIMLQVYLINRAMNELFYEVSNHSDRILVPLEGIQFVLND